MRCQEDARGPVFARPCRSADAARHGAAQDSSAVDPRMITRQRTVSTPRAPAPVDRGEQRVGGSPAELLQVHVDAGQRGRELVASTCQLSKPITAMSSGTPRPRSRSGVQAPRAIWSRAAEDGVDVGMPRRAAGRSRPVPSARTTR